MNGSLPRGLELVDVYKNHAVFLKELRKRCNNPSIDRALNKVCQIVTNLENNPDVAPPDFTDEHASAVWKIIRFNLNEIKEEETPFLILGLLVDQFVLFFGFTQPKVNDDGVRQYEFYTDIAKDEPFRYEALIFTAPREPNDVYLTLKRKEYKHENINRQEHKEICLIRIDAIPRMENQELECQKITKIFRKLYCKLKGCWVYLKCDNTPSISSSSDSVEEDFDF